MIIAPARRLHRASGGPVNLFFAFPAMLTYQCPAVASSKHRAVMTSSVSDTLPGLRQEIDRLDEAMHNLLMQRGEIIDRLIKVKRTLETGSAFRPAREAEMMRRLVERHKGILPLDTAESIWRVIIATFTYVQAPFCVHAICPPVMRPSATLRASTLVLRCRSFLMLAPRAWSLRLPAPRASGLVPASVPALELAAGAAWWNALELYTAPKIIARLPFVERVDHPAALPVFVVSRAAPEAMVREVEAWSVRIAGWNAATAREVESSERIHCRAG